MQADGSKQYRSKNVHVLSVQVVPHLAITVQHAASININVSASELEESGGILIYLLETVLLPVVRIIRELNVALNIYVQTLLAEVSVVV